MSLTYLKTFDLKIAKLKVFKSETWAPFLTALCTLYLLQASISLTSKRVPRNETTTQQNNLSIFRFHCIWNSASVSVYNWAQWILALTKLPVLYHMPMQFLCKAPGSQMEILSWLCGGTEEQRARADQGLRVLFVDISALTCGSVLNGPCLKSWWRHCSRTYPTSNTDLGQSFSLKTFIHADLNWKMHDQEQQSWVLVLSHQKSLQLWYTIALPK